MAHSRIFLSEIVTGNELGKKVSAEKSVKMKRREKNEREALDKRRGEGKHYSRPNNRIGWKLTRLFARSRLIFLPARYVNVQTVRA